MLVHPFINPRIKSVRNIWCPWFTGGKNPTAFLISVFWCGKFWRDSEQSFFCFRAPFKQVLLWQLLRHCLPFLPLTLSSSYPSLPPSLCVYVGVRHHCYCVLHIHVCFICVCRWMWGWYTSLLWLSRTSSSLLSSWRKWSGTSFSSAGSTATKDSSKRTIPPLLSSFNNHHPRLMSNDFLFTLKTYSGLVLIKEPSQWGQQLGVIETSVIMRNELARV